MVVYAAFGRIEPSSENRVYIDSSKRDELGVPLQQVQYSLNNMDRQTANQMALSLYPNNNLHIYFDRKIILIHINIDLRRDTPLSKGVIEILRFTFIYLKNPKQIVHVMPCRILSNLHQY
jgi:hypothetical protein